MINNVSTKNDSKRAFLKSFLEFAKNIGNLGGGYHICEHNTRRQSLYGYIIKYPARDYNIVGKVNGLVLKLNYVEVMGGFQGDGFYEIDLKHNDQKIFYEKDGGREYELLEIVRNKTAQIFKEKRKINLENDIGIKNISLKDLSLEEIMALSNKQKQKKIDSYMINI